MNLVPEWAPSVHSIVVPFPIALLFADVASFLTGRAAADGLDLPTTAIAAVGEHADGALTPGTLLPFLIYWQP